MKSILIVLAILTLASVAMAHNIPLPTGRFSATTTGSFAVCLNSNFQEVACGTSGAVAFPLTFLAVGETTGDSNGNSCQAYASTTSDFPVDKTPPEVATNSTTVGTLTDYDPSTGTGDLSFTGYSGGTCSGASFDSTGATQVSSGTVHFVVSEDGKRIDAIVTKLTDPVGGIGDFSLYGVNHKQ